MIDPRTQYILHKERENELMRQIERKLAAQERGESVETGQAWYLAAGQWLKGKGFSRGLAKSRRIEAESPCHG